MTLIACLHPRQCRTLFADVLISSKQASNQDFTLPTRAYIAPDWFKSLSAKPFAYRRKVIEITPQLVILWSGDYALAQQLARRARGWFRTSSPSEDDVRGLLDAHYREPIPGLHAIIVPASGDWLYNIGAVQRNQSPGCGEYFVAGSGSEIFTKMATQMLPSEGIVSPEHEALRIANQCMTNEFFDGEPIRALFGGAYEILYAGEEGFQRVDDLMHIFRLVQVASSNQVRIIQGPHVIRQWYSGSQLCIGSLSSPDAEQQKLGPVGFSVPDILEEPKKFIRSLEELAMTPKYMCIHHLFDFGKKQISCPMTMSGSDLIEQHFKITSDRSEVRLAHTAEYEERVLQMAKQLANREP
jgi:hypothetical protein